MWMPFGKGSGQGLASEHEELGELPSWVNQKADSVPPQVCPAGPPGPWHPCRSLFVTGCHSEQFC